MTETSVPDVAVQIAVDAIAGETDLRRQAELAVAALHERGWLHDPAEVAALREKLRGALDSVGRLAQERDAARAQVAELEAVARDLIDSANLVRDSAAAIVDRDPVDRFIALVRRDGEGEETP